MSTPEALRLADALDAIQSARFATWQADSPKSPEAAELRRQHAEIERLRADAARYRWLLTDYARGDGYTAIDAALNDGEADTQLSPAIDAAMRDAL